MKKIKIKEKINDQIHKELNSSTKEQINLRKNISFDNLFQNYGFSFLPANGFHKRANSGLNINNQNKNNLKFPTLKSKNNNTSLTNQYSTNQNIPFKIENINDSFVKKHKISKIQISSRISNYKSFFQSEHHTPLKHIKFNKSDILSSPDKVKTKYQSLNQTHTRITTSPLNLKYHEYVKIKNRLKSLENEIAKFTKMNKELIHCSIHKKRQNLTFNEQKELLERLNKNLEDQKKGLKSLIEEKDKNEEIKYKSDFKPHLINSTNNMYFLYEMSNTNEKEKNSRKSYLNFVRKNCAIL